MGVWVLRRGNEGHKQTRRGNSVFFGNSIKTNPWEFWTTDNWGGVGAAKQEGESFHAFTCVFSFTTGIYIWLQGCLSGLLLCGTGLHSGVGTGPGDNLQNTPAILTGTMLLRSSPPSPFTSNVPNQWKPETQRVSLTLIWKKKPVWSEYKGKYYSSWA